MELVREATTEACEQAMAELIARALKRRRSITRHEWQLAMEPFRADPRMIRDTAERLMEETLRQAHAVGPESAAVRGTAQALNWMDRRALLELLSVIIRRSLMLLGVLPLTGRELYAMPRLRRSDIAGSCYHLEDIDRFLEDEKSPVQGAGLR